MTTTKTVKKERTPDQIIADLEQKITDVRARAAAKEAKQNPEAKPFMIAVKAIDKALEGGYQRGDHEGTGGRACPAVDPHGRDGAPIAESKGGGGGVGESGPATNPRRQGALVGAQSCEFDGGVEPFKCAS